MPSIRLLTCLLCFALVSACSRKQKEEQLDGGSVKVQVPFMVDGGYSLQVVELFTLENLPSLKGLAARFLINPDAISGALKGRAPHLSYIRDKEGIIVPTDNLSLQLLTVYTHFEKLRELDQKMGIEGVLKYPRTVAVNSQLRTADGEKLVDNALYSGAHDSLLIVPYTLESFPLMANGGVLGHEHFHAIFQKLVIEPLKDKYPNPKMPTIHNENKLVELMQLQQTKKTTSSNRQKDKINRNRDESEAHEPTPDTPEAKAWKLETYHAVLLRGINEGFADVWGWVYTGDTSFVGRSLPSEKIGREMNFLPGDFFPPQVIIEAIDRQASDDELGNISYQHGTQLARMIRNFASLQAIHKKVKIDELRAHVGQILIKTLDAFQRDFGTLKAEEKYTLSRAASVFARQVPDLTSKECFLFAKNMPGEDPIMDIMAEECQAIEKMESKSSIP